jgi:thiamine-phosphate pyrophosphorylase
VSRTTVSLPPLLVLTDRSQCEGAGRSLTDVVQRICDASVPLAVLFREKDLPSCERRRLGEQVAALAHAAGVPLIVASDADLAGALGAAAVHLAATDAADAVAMPHSRSCHDAAEVHSAIAEGAAYVTVSPIFATSSKPGYGPAIGEIGLRVLTAEATGVPVYALGGVTPREVSACTAAGAAGVAVMGAVMAAADPAAVVRDLTAQLVGAGR